MAIELIGAGFGRTGTLSLKLALERLGFGPCYHMHEVMAHPEHALRWSQAHAGEAVDWDALFEGYRATVDWPSCNWWREQLAHWPDAKVILTLRDSAAWYRSVMRTIHRVTVENLGSDDARVRASAAWADEIIWQRVFDGRMDDEAHVMGVFERHNAEVIEQVPAGRLLVTRPGDGWEPLCAFLGVPVPDEPYPHVNTTEAFGARLGS